MTTSHHPENLASTQNAFSNHHLENPTPTQNALSNHQPENPTPTQTDKISPPGKMFFQTSIQKIKSIRIRKHKSRYSREQALTKPLITRTRGGFHMARPGSPSPPRGLAPYRILVGSSIRVRKRCTSLSANLSALAIGTIWKQCGSSIRRLTISVGFICA